MSCTEVDLYRSVRREQFPDGIFDDRGPQTGLKGTVMPTISAQHLVLIIQAVDAKISELDIRLDSLPPDQGAELEPLLLQYINAAKELEREYRAAAAQFSNFPPYEKLVMNEP